MKYSDLLSINKNFQYSVNIDFDLNDPKKIEQYIPTHDVCDVLKVYVRSLLGYEKDKATTLVGPYGKGKSFLILVLLYIASVKANDTLKSLIDRIRVIDSELANYIFELKEKNRKFLPVIINSNYDDISQSFLLALNDALIREGLDKIVPNTVFDVCLEMIDKWEKDPELSIKTLEKCLDVNKINLKQLRKGLSAYSKEAYVQFENLYNCVINGQSFNPMISNDIVKVYSDIAYQIKEYGYSGVFIVFDEFSKFLESTSTNLMSDLAIIQRLAEEANRSDKNSQIHLCCITHKSINLYTSTKDENRVNAFRTVEGRFKEIRFNRSLDENYDMISYAIIKKDSYSDYFNSQSSFVEFFNTLKDKLSFVNDSMIKGCFPLNPITSYALIQLSEVVAQNERTLFTFLSDNDSNSLSSFIVNNNDGLFNIDRLYDYFEILFKKESNSIVKSNWFRCSGALSKTNIESERKILKAISILNMISENDEVTATEEYVMLSLNMTLSEFNVHIKNLYDKHLIRRNIINNVLSFTTANSKQIDDEISKIIATKLKNVRLADILDEITDTKYLLPRRHNQENKITRFFKVISLTEKELKNIVNFSTLYKEIYCDGLVIRLIRTSSNIDDLVNKFLEINDKRVVLQYPNEVVEGYALDELKRISALKLLLSTLSGDEDNYHEVELLLEESLNDVKYLFDNYFSNSTHVSPIVNNLQLSETLSSIMDIIFSKKLIFNNELINKKNVSSQYQKSINNVIEWILDPKNNTLPSSETCPESTIINSVVMNKNNGDIPEVIDIIKSFIFDCEEERKSISNCVLELIREPYGIRIGIIPILFAIALSEINGNAVLYYQTKQVELCAENLVKAIVSDTDKYKIRLSRGTKERTDYLRGLVAYLKIQSTGNDSKDEMLVFERLKVKFNGVPNIVRSTSEIMNYLNLSDEFIRLKNHMFKFNINSFDTLFITIPECYKTKDYKKALSLLINDFSIIDSKIFEFKEKIRTIIGLSFDEKFNGKSSIKSVVDTWISFNQEKIDSLILSDKFKNLYKVLTSLNYDDIQSINYISKVITNNFIEDWSEDLSSFIQSSIYEFIDLISKVTETTKKDLFNNNFEDEIDGISSIGEIVKNSLESVFDEYGESISNEEKVKILLSMIKKIM